MSGNELSATAAPSLWHHLHCWIGWSRSARLLSLKDRPDLDRYCIVTRCEVCGRMRGLPWGSERWESWRER
ncbi:conserved protein of unknown function [Rhodovastum atsumiense]|uniref:Uncharacterized protein n=1 Tax=Rhodovastum atsumiense TaxID=504468 RepID=A0A5M6IKY7_9PROT|nr:hypothetical protein [Rhodovastum atsumiense]KAA5608238.1 hypothetical protein F1189_30045 [Rhodovastum atsumiense]CAH2602609.1 conserved protein of unknown function [Rhodovastum atsumiense]